MTETVNETTTAPEPVTFREGDRVKVAGSAFDGAGYATPTRVLGKVAKLAEFDYYSGWYVVPEGGSTGGYVSPKYLTPFTETDELRERITTLETAVATATARVDAQTDALATFQARVREALVAKADDVDDDDAEPFDDLLDTLGLDPRVREFSVRVEVRGSYFTTVEATSLDAAIQQAREFSAVREYLSEDYNMQSGWLDDVEADEE